MATLTIRFTYGRWYISSNASSGPGYYFKGETAEEQFVNVQRLQNAMVQGQGSVSAELPEIFDRVTPGQEQEIMDELFESTGELFFEANAVFDSAEGADLLVDIVEAGEALAAFV